MKNPKNILLTCTVNLGDVVLATSAAALIKKTMPECRVSMLVKDGIGLIIEQSPVVDEVITLNNKAKSRSWKEMWQFAMMIRKRSFDMSIAFDRKLRPALLTLLAGIPIRVGPDRIFDYKPSNVTLLYNRIVKMPADFLHTHQAELFQVIVRAALGIKGQASPRLGPVSCQSMDSAKKMLAELANGKTKIALCIKGTYSLRNWPVGKFAQLVDSLRVDYDAEFFIVGALEDWPEAEQLCGLTKEKILNLCGKTTLLELAGLLKQSDLFITIDTGSMHIAAAMDVTTVGIFRCATQWRWAPFTNRAKVVTGGTVCNLIDRPEACPVPPCPRLEGVKLYPCVDAITVEQVKHAAVELLALSRD